MNRNELKELIKALLILPFNVLITIPALILLFSRQPFVLPNNVLLGFAVAAFLIGAVLAVSTVRLFLKKGLGTPAPWAPPRKLVLEGPYLYVRNPMISGVLFMLMAEVILFMNDALSVWFFIFLLVNVIYIPVWEEPGLLKRFGKEYEEYARNVPRWIPRLSPWEI